MASPPNPLKAPQHVLTLLARLHRESLEQEASLGQYLTDSAEFHDAMRDKFIALDEDKCQFVYHLACAIGARNIVEAGTSFGVSTIYLALAVGNNIKRLGGQGIVIGTEKESSKAEKAAEYWREAGDSVEPYIELRVGDLQETLKLDLPIVDLLLLDIWAPMALPALRLVEPRMRSGSVVIIDNSISSAGRYAELLGYLRSDDSAYTNLTIPYSNGLEMCIKL